MGNAFAEKCHVSEELVRMETARILSEDLNMNQWPLGSDPKFIHRFREYAAGAHASQAS